MSANSLVVAVAQLAGTDDVALNLSNIEQMVTDAAGQGARLIVFPEAVMFDYNASGDKLKKISSAEAPQFEKRLADLATTHGITIVAGLYGETNGPRSSNTLIVAEPSSRLLLRYEKIHLYDAFHFRESDKHDPALLQPNFEELVIFEIDGVRFGLANCYDLRFPEMSRLLIDKGADVLVVASGWVAGPLKEFHWTTLLKARAIENTCFVVGSCQPAPRSAGLSMIIDPMGVSIAGVPENEGLAVATISLSRQQQVRAILPCLAQRRYAVGRRVDQSSGPLIEAVKN